jgi:transcription-repair coupling factor (superfamily II helicase)
MPSSLALRALLKTAATRGGLHRPRPLVTGLSPAAVAFHAAIAADEGPVFLIAPTDNHVEQLVADARFFLANAENMTYADAERAVRPFPSQEVDPYRGLLPHLEVASARAGALHGLAAGTARIVVASARALLPRLSDPARFAEAGFSLELGQDISPRELGDRLVRAGFTHEDPVDEHGEFCVRGGIVDFYPTSEAQPVRLEFVGDTIESIRRFDAATQRSMAALDKVSVTPQRELIPEDDANDHRPEDVSPEAYNKDRSAWVLDYVRRSGAAVLVYEHDDVTERGTTLEEQWRSTAADLANRGRPVPAYETIAIAWTEVERWIAGARQITELAIDPPSSASAVGYGATSARQALPDTSSHITARPAAAYHGRIGDWVDEIRAARSEGDRIVFVAATPGRAERTIELLADYEIRARSVADTDDLENAAVLVTTGHLSRGFHLPDAHLRIFAESDLFEEERRPHERRRSANRTFLSDFRDLKIGDLVVHVDNGIGRFVGLKKIGLGAGQDEQEFMELRYAGEDKLFVSLEHLDLVQKYTGGSAAALDKLGGATWEKAKTRVKKAMRDMAEELLKLYAARKAVMGHAFSPDSHWQQEFAAAFEYDLTPDQTTAIADITRDLESTTPMDRLLCGDVGYGKTEVAMRAAFKVVMEGKQVAFLAPTTILAFQHLRTIKERFAGFPVRADMISRFRTKAEQKVSLEQLASGHLDIIIGTHRLLSKDVTFRDLGLLVVDEEQRFGVAHKERIKQMRRKVDVLTMTATPIPRTLNMSLAGIRDMSVIETPPRDRLSIQTQVVKFDTDAIARAVRTELERGGQVFLVHNRVESIHSIASLVTRLVPEAKVVVGHGQMGEDDLEKVMIDFVSHKFDVLVATTIVENGLDIPNANTIIINRADRYGLAQLYQLRGRVGRSDRRAYAYLLIPPEQTLSPVARRRLAAIREFSDLGSGFRIAALDLEIRGAGNLLGGEQSGHIEAVGFDMYMKLLEDAVRELKGEDLDDDRRATVNLKIDLHVDDEYIPDMNQRLSAYRRMASARTLDEVDRLLEELQDRYGPMSDSVLNLAQHTRVRVIADRIGLDSIERDGTNVVLKFRQDAKLDPAMLLKLIKSRRDLTLLPPAVLRLALSGAQAEPVRSESQRKGTGKPTASWWTARAASGVAPGFNRESMTAETRPNPSEPGGLFERLGELLEQLSQSLVTG